MGRIYGICGAAALFGIIASSAAAQQPLTLDRAVQEALANNPAVRVARATTVESSERETEARSGFFPRFSFTESWQRGDQPVFVFGSLLSSRQFTARNFAIDELNHPEATNFFHGAFALDQVVFDGGRTRSTVSTAQQQRAIATIAVTQAEADVTLATTQAFGRLLIAEAARRSAEDARAAAEEDVARAVRRRDAGTATDADVLALQVHMTTMRQAAIQAAGDAAVARAEINRLMGRSAATEFEAAEPAPVPVPAEDLEKLLAEAESSRPELRRAETERQLAETAVRAAHAVWWPQIAAQAGYELSGTQFNDRASAWIVGGQLRWTLSTGGGDLAHQRAAAAGVLRAQAAEDDQRAAVQVEVVSAYRRLESARAREAVARTSVDQARESQRILRDRYEAGMTGVTDVLRAAAAVSDADTQRIAALVDAMTSDAALKRAIGRK